MSDKPLNQLPAETVKLIASTQIITSVSTAVKELIENSLDADARNIQVKLENYGFDVLEVKDDGLGISYNNIQRMFLSGYTSKIACFHDLGKLQTYGFRGEALSALTKLAKVSVATKTGADALAMTYVISHDGIPESSKPSHLAKGTIVTATDIFSKLPVRKQYLSGKKRASEELKKVEYVVQAFSVIHPELRITLYHNKCLLWQKNAVKGIKQSFMQVVGLKVVNSMDHLNELGNNILVDLIVPKKNMDNIDNVVTNSSQNIFVYVNRRPIILSKVSKLVTEHVFHHYIHLNPSNKYTVCLISIEVPPQEIDVNLEPNKTKVFLKNEIEVINLIDHMLSCYYSQNISRLEHVERLSKEEFVDNCEKGEEEDENNMIKRARLENAECPNEVSVLRDHEFSGKNDGWQLEVVTSDDLPQEKDASLSICSQINLNNCTLTSNEEVGELKKLLNGSSSLLVTSVNTNSEAGLLSRNEVNDCINLNSVETAGRTVILNNFKELPCWPVRHSSKAIAESKFGSQGKIHNTEQNSGDHLDSKTPDNDLSGNFLDNIDLMDWSNGTVETGNGVLPSGAVLAKSRPAEVCTNEVTEEDIDQFELSVRKVSREMSKKELNAFFKFARIMKPKILEEFPGMAFINVAMMLVDRWKTVPLDDKIYYEKLSGAVDIKRGTPMKKKTLEENKTGKLSPVKEKVKTTAHKRERHELNVITTLQEIKQKKWSIGDTGNANDCIQLIGQLQPSGNWLYKKGKVVGHVRHSSLQELVLSHKMLSSHCVPRHPLSKALLLNESILGIDLWNVLKSMNMEYDPVCCSYTIVSDIITKNGFKINMEKRENIFGCGWITEVASMIPFFGVSELRETLSLYRTSGENTDLGHLRPSAVINYITNEVIRIVQQSLRPPDLSDIVALIDTWQKYFSELPAQCVHSRDIFVPIYLLNT